MKEVVTKEYALKHGLPTYYTGKPCKRGHYAERRAKHRDCLECQKVYRQENKERTAAYDREYYLKYVKGYKYEGSD